MDAPVNGCRISINSYGKESLIVLHSRAGRNFSKLEEARKKRSVQSRASVITNQLNSVMSTQQAWTNFKDSFKDFTETPKKFNKERVLKLDLSPKKESKKIPVSLIQLPVNNLQPVKSFSKTQRRNSRLERVSSLKEGMIIGDIETDKAKGLLSDAIKVYKVLKDSIRGKVDSVNSEISYKADLKLKSESNQSSTDSLLLTERKAAVHQITSSFSEIAKDNINFARKSAMNSYFSTKEIPIKEKVEKKKQINNELELISKGKKITFKVVGVQLNKNYIRGSEKKENLINKLTSREIKT